MPIPHTLPELLSQAAKAIEFEWGEVDIEKTIQTLEHLREVNNNWIQTEGERKCVDDLLNNMCGAIELLHFGEGRN